MAFAKFQENRFRIYGDIAENHAILVNLTASIVRTISPSTIICSGLERSLYLKRKITNG